MRVIFNEELKQVADDLDRMAQDVSRAIHGAGNALLKSDVEAAQTVIDGDIEIDALESSVIDQCIRLLAKQSPVATDLRVIVSTLRLSATFERMGDLATAYRRNCASHLPTAHAAPGNSVSSSLRCSNSWT
jgi:phosphate transport system protein